MVVMLVSVVGGVFIVFALMALCYRSVVVHRNLSLCLRLVESFHYVARRDGPKKKKKRNRKKQTASVVSWRSLFSFDALVNITAIETKKKDLIFKKRIWILFKLLYIQTRNPFARLANSHPSLFHLIFYSLSSFSFLFFLNFKKETYDGCDMIIRNE